MWTKKIKLLEKPSLLYRGACVSIEVDDETIEDKIEEKMPDVVIGSKFSKSFVKIWNQNKHNG